MNLNEYLKLVLNLFETKYPQFWWEDFFLEHEKVAVQKILKKDFEELCPPSMALEKLLKTLGRM